jgi:hypothetical protein
MKTLLFLFLATGVIAPSYAQVALDTTTGGTAVIIKDSRIDVLSQKLLDYNVAMASNANRPTTTGTTSSRTSTETSSEPTAKRKTSISGIVLTSGYRLMVISTPDRELAMRVRSQLFQSFPGQKQYMEFQMPNTKIKFGNFLDRGQADKMRKQIMGMKLVTNNIYILPCTVEMKVDKTVLVDDDRPEATVKKKSSTDDDDKPKAKAKPKPKAKEKTKTKEKPKEPKK